MNPTQVTCRETISSSWCVFVVVCNDSPSLTRSLAYLLSNQFVRAFLSDKQGRGRNRQSLIIRLSTLTIAQQQTDRRFARRPGNSNPYRNQSHGIRSRGGQGALRVEPEKYRTLRLPSGNSISAHQRYSGKPECSRLCRYFASPGVTASKTWPAVHEQNTTNTDRSIDGVFQLALTFCIPV